MKVEKIIGLFYYGIEFI